MVELRIFQSGFTFKFSGERLKKPYQNICFNLNTSVLKMASLSFSIQKMEYSKILKN